MSTFDGIIREFPDIRVDFFRNNGAQSPLACFLSHVHSDHLAGLESLRSPFVYCSAATRELLLRLERYPCRINHAKGILEARVQTYKHLRSILKPIPLETPTAIELAPGRTVVVTLLDANHCTGAVMFLFEGDGKAVLYTGDIRSEPWHVNSIARSPCMIAYSSGIKILDRIYLDTSNTEDVDFPSKEEGLKELLCKVSQYPKDTIFHFAAWTFGYESVWIALSKALGSRIHVDDYKLKLYRSLVATGDSADRFASQFHMGPEVAALVGFMCGNTAHPGCLTSDEGVRLHSCEKGNQCETVRDAEGNIVWIQPIVTRMPDGQDVAEVGIGGGAEDLERETELDQLSLQDVESLVQIMSEDAAISSQAKAKARQLLVDATGSGRNITLDLDIESLGDAHVDLLKVVEGIVKKKWRSTNGAHTTAASVDGGQLPRTITFPYSRHSSYPELCHLVRRFRPKDVWPCTVHEAEWIKYEITIRSLFGDSCSGDVFDHDEKMADLASGL